ncbi:MAG: AAA family ATPase, partial [Bacteroidia bacterium]|nr:AAA family ATPase [Bacteroidia bacterium]
LSELVEEFHSMGGEFLFLDEVHRYPNWAIEVKNSYDSYPNLKIVFTGSSMLEIHQSGADLSRRVVHYTLYGLSFREYLNFEYDLQLKTIPLEELITDHFARSSEITANCKILPRFNDYLKHGYYPFFRENVKSYSIRLQGVVNAVIDSDLPACSNIEYSTGIKIKRMLGIVSSLVPYTPNISKLSVELGISRNSLLSYIHLLHQARLIYSLERDANGMSKLTKPEKIFLDNPNLLYALSTADANDGNVRETFFVNQLKVKHAVTFSPTTDFTIDEKLQFEIGGKNKSFKQIKNIPSSYIALANVETGFANKIPLWLFGFLY